MSDSQIENGSGSVPTAAAESNLTTHIILPIESGKTEPSHNAVSGITDEIEGPQKLYEQRDELARLELELCA